MLYEKSLKSENYRFFFFFFLSSMLVSSQKKKVSIYDVSVLLYNAMFY